MIAASWILALVALAYAKFARPADHPEPAPKRWEPIVAALVPTAIGYVAFRIAAGNNLFPFDDSYISLAAARNLMERGAFELAPGHPLLGVTSPLHVALLALLGKLAGLERAARWIGFASHAFAAYFSFLVARRLSGTRAAAWAAGFLVGLSGAFAQHSLNGMETTFFVALVAAAWWLLEKTRGANRPPYALAVALALAVWTRPEGWFLAAACWTPTWVSAARAKDPVRLASIAAATGIFIALAAPSLMLNYFLTGSWLPSTAGAKATFFVAESATLLSSAGAATFAVFKLVLRLGLFVPFFLLGAWHLLRKGPGRFEIPLFSLLFYAAYIARFGMALNMYWLRYQMPIVLLYVIVSGVGLGAFARWTRERRAELALRFVAAFVMLAGASMDFAERIVDFRKDIVSTERGAHATALWLRDNTPENALIAAHDIGAPLYFSNRRVLDLVGLTDPDVARVNREDRTKAALWTHLAERRPDYLVMFKLWDEQFFHFSGRDTHGVLEPVWQSKPSRVRPGAQYVVYRCSWN